MVILYIRAALANLRVHKATSVINVVGLTLGIACFVLAFAAADYILFVDGDHETSSEPTSCSNAASRPATTPQRFSRPRR